MKTKLGNLWEKLRESLWFVPSLMVLGSIGCSIGLVILDTMVGEEAARQYWWIYTGGPAGARSVLSTVAGSMITVAGVAFSITIVTLTLASQQFGPRLLRNFMRDTGNQVVLGTFISTFLYCLLILRTIRGMDEGGETVPYLSVSFGVVLAILSLGVLIYFIHHVSASIQASNIIASVSRELERAIDKMFPEDLGRGESIEGKSERKSDLPRDFQRTCRNTTATDRGYLQAVDNESLMRIASSHDLILRMMYRPGQFVSKGSIVIEAYPGNRITGEIETDMRNCLLVGTQRTLEQDAEFAVHQLVEIAVRALSPGINDPFTAVTVLDHLESALGLLARRKIPSAYRYDHNGNLRMVVRPFTFVGMADTAFNQIRQYGRESVAVNVRLLEVLGLIARQIRRNEDREEIQRQVMMVERDSRTSVVDEEDRKEITDRFQKALEFLTQGR